MASQILAGFRRGVTDTDNCGRGLCSPVERHCGFVGFRVEPRGMARGMAGAEPDPFEESGSVGLARVNQNAPLWRSPAACPPSVEARHRMGRICSGSSGLTLGHPLSCRRSDEAAWIGGAAEAAALLRQSGPSGGTLARDSYPRSKEYGTAVQARRGQVVDFRGKIVCDGG